MLDIIPNWHPILVHFTVSFISSLGVLQLIIWLKIAEKKQSDILFMQKTLMVISTLSLLVTLFTGWLAFNSVAHDSPSHMAMTDHRNWALTTAAVFLLSVIIYFLRPSLRSNLVGVLLVISSSLVAVTGFKGGEVVYRYGLGVMSLPQVSEASKDGDDGHDHEHGEPMTELPFENKLKMKPHLNDGHSH
ncbi:MAG: hypothetical protein JKX82_13200 [Oleispira sp.]|nr:hypothetical protein [Oleispira sp.]